MAKQTNTITAKTKAMPLESLFSGPSENTMRKVQIKYNVKATMIASSWFEFCAPNQHIHDQFRNLFGNQIIGDRTWYAMKKSTVDTAPTTRISILRISSGDILISPRQSELPTTVRAFIANNTNSTRVRRYLKIQRKPKEGRRVSCPRSLHR